MFDDLFDLFDRGDDDGDGRDRRRQSGQRQGGIRGFFARLFGDDDNGYDERDARRAGDRAYAGGVRDDDGRPAGEPRRYEDDDDDYAYDRRGRRRRRDDDDDDGPSGFGFGDD